MLLALIICQLSVLIAANPFHKYPFVFLLDVGNEELDKTNSEQIRLSIPGGSVALRYPAIGDGNTIGHIRVSGIDFGSDLKANIVDGGPGYKYVVLVFMGNPGAPYDAVVTVQTVIDQTFDIPNIGNIANSEDDAGQVEDANDSAEDLSDDSSVSVPQSNAYIQSTNAEFMQSSSNVYKYAENEVMDTRDYSDEQGSDVLNDDDDALSDELDDDSQELEINIDENASDQKDIHKEYSDDIDQINDPDVQVKGIDTGNEDDDSDNDEEIGPKIVRYASNDYAEDNEPISVDDGSKPHLNGDEEYYQDDKQNNNRPDYQQQPLDYEDPDEIEPIFNDGEVHKYKYRDSNNNNYIDSDDSYAVAY